MDTQQKTGRMTPAEKQKAYRVRQEEKQMRFNRQATSMRAICFAVEGLMSLGVEKVTLHLPAINHISEIDLRGREIENQLVMAQLEAQEARKAAESEKGKVTGKRRCVPGGNSGDRSPSLGTSQSKPGRRKRQPKAATVPAQ